MINPFISAYSYFSKRRRTFLLIILLLALGGGYFASGLRLEEDVLRLVPSDGPKDRYQMALKNTKMLDNMVIRIYPADTAHPMEPSLLINYGDDLFSRLQDGNYTHLIRNIRYNFSDRDMEEVFGLFYHYLPYYLEDEDYRRIDSLLTPEAIDKAMHENYKFLISPAGIGIKSFLIRDPLGITSLGLDELKAFQPDDNFEIFRNRIFTRDHQNLLLILTPAFPSSETSRNQQLIDHIDRTISALNREYGPGVQAEYFGGVAVAVANARRIKKDVMLTVGIAFLLILTFMMIYFRRKSIIPVIIVPVLLGALLALGIISLAKGTMSAIALGVGSVLVGIAIDYALHFFTHYQATGSVKKVLRDISLPILISCVTTASAFLCLELVSSYALRDVGVFAALSVIFAALFALLVLPHMVRGGKRKAKEQFIHRFTSYPFHRNIYLKGIVILFTMISLFYFRDVRFDEDLESMSYMSEHLRRSEENINRISNISQRTIYIVSTGRDMDEALRANSRLKPELDALKSGKQIQDYLLPSDLLLSDSVAGEKIERWNTFWDGKRDSTLARLYNAGRKYKFKKSSFDEFKDLIQKDPGKARDTLNKKLTGIFLNAYVSAADSVATIVTTVKVQLDDKALVHERLGDMKDQVIIDRQYLAMRYVNMLRSDFGLLVTVSLSVVFLILLISFGRIELALITFIPMTISWIWTLGIMGLFGVKFTIFNVVISTFIFGLGIDYSIFITRGMLQRFKYGRDNLPSYKTSIFLSALTTISGVGVLILASHPALKSIAAVSVIGISSVVFLAYTLQPILFEWLIMHRGKKRFAPVTMKDFLFAMLALVIFVGGTLFLTLIGALLLFILPVGKKHAKYMLHYLVMLSFRLVIYAPFNIRKKILGFDVSKFRKPAVIIGNHQSHIDILLVLMLYPRIIVLTNQKVQRRIYGILVRMVDFFPVTPGLEDALEKISKKVDQGYSVLIFPEGTRSDTDHVQRFHKGAFYLADRLQMDILPVIFHGVGDVLKKGELFLRTGRITMKILERVPFADASFGTGYRERSKVFRKYITSEYERLKEAYGGPDYQRRQVLRNYVYRGPVLEWYLRAKLRMEKNYKLVNEAVPAHARVLDLGCGYGFISYLLHLVSPDRQVTGIDYDEHKIQVAAHAFFKNDKLHFMTGDVRNAVQNEFDAFLLSDVLHYMPGEAQLDLLARCAESLSPGGVIIIREGDTGMRDKHRRTKMTEFLSTRILRFNKLEASEALCFLSTERILKLAGKYGLKTEIRGESRITSNKWILLRKGA